MSPKLLASLLSMALLLPAGGAALAAPPAPDASREAATQLVQAGQNEGLTGQVVFQLLLAEVALQRGQVELAVSAYQDLALRTRDPAVVKRAVELAGMAQQYGIALELARLWVELEPESQPARQNLAGLMVMAGRLDELGGPIAEMLASDPAGLGGNFLNLNRLLSRYPDKDAVLAFVEQVAQPYPTLPEAYYAVAVAAAGAGQLERARSEVRRAQALKPEWDAPVLLEAQLLLREEGGARIEEALTVLNTYLARQPDSVEVRLHLARVLIGAKKYHEARQQFDLLLQKNPDNPEVVYPVAMLALQEKDLETARNQFARLLELPFPDRGAVHYFLGQVEEEAGNVPTALLHYDQVRGGAQHLAARGRGARLLADQGKLDEALAFLRKADVRAPREKVQLAQLEAQLLREGGRYDATYTVLAAALKQQPEQPDLLYDTALAAEKVGKVQEMEVHLKKLIKLQPDNAHAFNALGYSLAERKLRLKEAHELISKAVSLAPQDPFIMDSLGWVLYRQGKLGQAQLVLEKAYEIKADPEIAAHLGEVLWAQGRKEEARALWLKAASQAPDHETLRAIIKKFQL